MGTIDLQEHYWDSVASEKDFTHPISADEIKGSIPADGRILDYGCGYGRSCEELISGGLCNVVGVDISSQMIARGLAANPRLDLRHFDGMKLPFPDKSFAACTLVAVLTCIPTNAGQRQIASEINRVLVSGGVLLVSDYPFQSTARNKERYRQFENEFGLYGTFRLSDGGVVRHHDMEWIYELWSQFEIVCERQMDAFSMNGNAVEIFQILAKKLPTGS